MSYIRLTLELPRITAVRLNAEPDTMQAFLDSLRRGEQRLVLDPDPFAEKSVSFDLDGGRYTVKVDELEIRDGVLVRVVKTDVFSYPIVTVIAWETDFVVWNQAGETHIVHVHPDAQWTNELVPAALRLLVVPVAVKL